MQIDACLCCHASTGHLCYNLPNAGSICVTARSLNLGPSADALASMLQLAPLSLPYIPKEAELREWHLIANCMQGGDAVSAEPEVRQITLPQTGGRLIIASDGLWDAVQPKTAAHHVRNLAASKAATELVRVHISAYVPASLNVAVEDHCTSNCTRHWLQACMRACR